MGRAVWRAAVRVIPTIVVPQSDVGENLTQIAHVYAFHAAHPLIVVVDDAVAIIVRVNAVTVQVIAVVVHPPFPLLPVPLSTVVAAVIATSSMDLVDIVVVVIVAIPLSAVEVDMNVDG